MLRIKRAADLAALKIGASKQKKPRAKPRRLEAALLKQVLAWLKLKGVWHFRINSGMGFQGGRPVRAAPAGTPDIIAVIQNGRMVGIELKSSRGKLRAAQLAWKVSAEAVGVIYLCVRSLEELIEALAKEGVR